MADLRIFDLQRFALHDGPGIRTTVFLKGCPLDCIWCHNPESKRRDPQLGYLDKRCIRCGKCAQLCPRQVHHVSEQGMHTVSFASCNACGSCIQICPNRALKLFGTEISHEEILETVLRDRDFYARSGGGLTVSGGEPMLQFLGLRQLLRDAKGAGLHVCLDTSGQAETGKYRDIADYVDIFLFDYKLTDPKLHRTYTGVGNRLILKNLDMLCRMGKTIFLRCPIIPGINDNQEHYQAIAKLSRKYDAIEQVNVMPYHDMAKGKADEIGIPYALKGMKTIENDGKEQILSGLRKAGCLRIFEN